MTAVFYLSAAIAVVSAVLVVTRADAMRALVYLVAMFIAMASALWTLGAPFAAALQILVYAGAIAVLFVFAVMILNPGQEAVRREKQWLRGRIWAAPILLVVVLVVQLALAFVPRGGVACFVGPKAVGISMFMTYLIGVELASVLLLAGLVAAFHFRVNLDSSEADDE